MSILQKLEGIRRDSGIRITPGLNDPLITRFAALDPRLESAADDALRTYREMEREFPDMLQLDEREQVVRMHAEIINFYTDDAVNPYVTLAASGPWIITAKGAVIYDTGGYGMLGFGHAPEAVLATMCKRQVMANIMSANFSQLRFSNALRKEIGHRRGNCPYDGFMCLNSGSEAISLAARISDINARLATCCEGTHAGKAIKHLALSGGFHGRTDRPAHYSDSSRSVYLRHLASFQDDHSLLTVTPNDLEELEAVFERARREGFFIESMFMEPVMGEGNPGLGLSRQFYDRARSLTREHGALLLVDSIQAGLRAHGCLSIVDYPGFEDIEPPDMEAYSKALNAGQFPLSVLAVTERGTRLYQKGVYGNTMTSNPRALDVACQVLAQMTPQVRANIRKRGQKLLSRLQQLRDELGGLITEVQGTGLLVSCSLHPDFKSYGAGSIEEYMRMQGVGVIHGGENALRFTPHFNISPEEIELIVEATRQALLHGPRRKSERAA